MASFNEMLEKMGKSLSGYIDDVIPRKNFGDEIATYVNSNQKIKSFLNMNTADEILKSKLETATKTLSLDEDVASQLASKMKNMKYSDQAFTELAESLKKTEGVNPETVDKFVAMSQNKVSQALTSDINIDDLTKMQKAGFAPAAYFTNPEKRNVRIGTAVGVYGVGAVAGRYMSGGTLTTDKYGKKDIAGIPFI